MPVIEIKTGGKYYFETDMEESIYCGYAIGFGFPRIVFYDLNAGVEFGRFKRTAQRVELAVTSILHVPIAIKVSYGIGF